MIQSNYIHLDKISSSYFIKADTLFRTLIFMHESAIHINNQATPNIKKAWGDLESILKKNPSYTPNNGNHHDVINHYIPTLCFSTLVSAFEDYITEIARLMFSLKPEHLDKVKLDYKTYKNLPPDEIIDYLTTEAIASITFSSANEYINKICKLTEISKKDNEALIKSFIEIKARRDIGVHNNWVKDRRYEQKLSEVNIAPSEKTILTPDLSYFTHAFNTCGALVKIISNNISTNVLKEKALFPQPTQK
ncbi:hypothetical protein [Klebsiella pneumoniae]|uniref:hypothetical protein n=1 Tax=Klebsiella pneumoniae TaxID=573 RepID=UPI000E2C0FA7|nr:hypothetical protein [Klebsiella pneumoniae]SWN03603.1 Uncharacterised protein [Klebsiella pneumoniae]HBZ7693681.1 hypothetical protein [Klebsiella variicola subsp. variicola]